MPLFQNLNCFLPQRNRWFDEVRIQILYAENLIMPENQPECGFINVPKPSKPPRFYVQTLVRGQKHQDSQRTNEVELTKTEYGSCVEWYFPMKIKICIQSLFQNPIIEFHLIKVQVHENKFREEQEIGQIRVSLKSLYNLPERTTSTRIPIKHRYNGLDKGVLFIKKVFN